RFCPNPRRSVESGSRVPRQSGGFGPTGSRSNIFGDPSTSGRKRPPAAVGHSDRTCFVGRRPAVSGASSFQHIAVPLFPYSAGVIMPAALNWREGGMSFPNEGKSFPGSPNDGRRRTGDSAAIGSTEFAGAMSAALNRAFEGHSSKIKVVAKLTGAHE